ncbi:hypothetical protein OOK41_00870 [Micromonospora sp. NBC_01655]|uniref:hypothetical protein n=1 Tax=Micromonospora sp. NBC_01655 TaxID=2975983 RepID=UPI00225715D4|nr:hypothetical protein [Micromonospora sp. NBC_01655]MCX4468879.1 hypothetical protein [Micromonospora sp. NBC_01655]
MSTTAATGARAPSSVRLLTTIHLAFAGAFLLVTALYLGRMAATGAGPADMLTGHYDPKDLVPFGLSGMNPFTWFYALVALLYLVGFLVSPALAMVSLPLLARTWHELSRPARALLLAGIVSAVALPLLRLIPAVGDMHRWWLD